MAFSPSTLDSIVGPNAETVARIGTPVPSPPSVKNSHGKAFAVHCWPSACVRAVSFSPPSPGAAIPDRSPFMSARNTGDAGRRQLLGDALQRLGLAGAGGSRRPGRAG